jgi:hypothetical protein
MDSFSSLITALGGPTEVAAELRMPPGTVQKMKDRDSIKPKHWPHFIKLAKKRGLSNVSLESLARLTVERQAAA